MTKYQIFLLSIATVSWVFLCGLNMAVDNDKLILESQKATVEPDSYATEHARQLMEANSKVRPVKASPQTTKQKTSKPAKADANEPIKPDQFEKPLDLSVPEKDFENADRIMAQRPATQSPDTPIFAPENKTKARPIELNGNFLMSPEPEAEKRKSVDGAGIVINIKR